MRITIQTISLLLFFSIYISAQPDFSQLVEGFTEGYQKLNIPNLGLSFVNNFNEVQSLDSLNIQEEFFLKYKLQLKSLSQTNISSSDFINYGIMKFEVDRNLERIKLSKVFKNNYLNEIKEEKISDLPNGKEWYEYYVKVWTGSEAKPDELIKLGEKEIAEAENEIKKIILNSGKNETEFYNNLNDQSFFLNNNDSILSLFLKKEKVFRENLSNQFNGIDKISELKIERGTNKRMAAAPGYYFPSTQTFYYNLFDKPYNTSQLDWLLIHEGIPGHHFQSEWINNLKLDDIRNTFTYFGFLEGWAAYAEEIGKEIGAYKTPYDYLGKWEWDLIRSVRVVLDVRLNYYGWSDEKAMNYWKEHIKDKDAIGVREINRMKRWPAQIHTYKYGSNKILDIKSKLQKELGDKFDIKKFHDAVLNCGTIPFTFFEEILIEKMNF